MMYNWYDDRDMAMTKILAEDAATPELRNPSLGGLHGKSWLKQLARLVRA